MFNSLGRASGYTIVEGSKSVPIRSTGNSRNTWLALIITDRHKVIPYIHGSQVKNYSYE